LFFVVGLSPRVIKSGFSSSLAARHLSQSLFPLKCFLLGLFLSSCVDVLTTSLCPLFPCFAERLAFSPSVGACVLYFPLVFFFLSHLSFLNIEFFSRQSTRLFPLSTSGFLKASGFVLLSPSVPLRRNIILLWRYGLWFACWSSLFGYFRNRIHSSPESVSWALNPVAPPPPPCDVFFLSWK